MFRLIVTAVIFFAASQAWAADKTEVFDDKTECSVLADVTRSRVAVDVLLGQSYIATVWQYAEDDATNRGGVRVLPKSSDPKLLKMLKAVGDVCDAKPDSTVHDAAEAVFLALYLTSK